jgi:hypothetical protein
MSDERRGDRLPPGDQASERSPDELLSPGGDIEVQRHAEHPDRQGRLSTGPTEPISRRPDQEQRAQRQGAASSRSAQSQSGGHPARSPVLITSGVVTRRVPGPRKTRPARPAAATSPQAILNTDLTWCRDAAGSRPGGRERRIRSDGQSDQLMAWRRLSSMSAAACCTRGTRASMASTDLRPMWVERLMAARVLP